MNTIANLCTTLLTAAAAAQLPGPGLTWSGTTANAGSYLPSCTTLPVNVTSGENVTLKVWGDMNAPFLLFGAGPATQCLPYPGVGNGLVLDFPIALLASGLLTHVTPCLSCPPGFEPLPFTVPLGLPPGLSASFQAVSFGNSVLSFTVAITATLQ